MRSKPQDLPTPKELMVELQKYLEIEKVDGAKWTNYYYHIIPKVLDKHEFLEFKDLPCLICGNRPATMISFKLVATERKIQVTEYVCSDYQNCCDRLETKRWSSKFKTAVQLDGPD